MPTEIEEQLFNTHLNNISEAVNLTESLHGRSVGVFRLGLLLLSVVGEEGRVASERNSNFTRQVGVLVGYMRHGAQHEV